MRLSSVARILDERIDGGKVGVVEHVLESSVEANLHTLSKGRVLGDLEASRC